MTDPTPLADALPDILGPKAALAILLEALARVARFATGTPPCRDDGTAAAVTPRDVLRASGTALTDVERATYWP